jgi:hypothetical protein
MTMNRRDFVVGTTLSALLPKGQPCNPDGGPSQNYVNILLHGLFFMEFIGNVMVVTSPVVAGHEIKAGCGFLVDLPGGTNIDLTESDLCPGSTRCFPKSMLVIPRMSVGNITGAYALRITLPLPQEIVTLRHVKHKEMQGTCSGKTCTIFCNACEDRFGLLTCLRYLSKRNNPLNPLNFAFHAEHPEEPSVAHANHAYKAARGLFKGPGGFDLCFTKLGTTVGFDDGRPYGITLDDQRSLFERTPRPLYGAPTPVNCMMFGIGG